jgi:hypothetical protein
MDGDIDKKIIPYKKIAFEIFVTYLIIFNINFYYKPSVISMYSVNILLLRIRKLTNKSGKFVFIF